MRRIQQGEVLLGTLLSYTMVRTPSTQAESTTSALKYEIPQEMVATEALETAMHDSS